MSGEEAPATNGYETYAAFIKAQVDSEEARKTSIEAKGVAVITTSGALITLLFGLSAIFTGKQTYTPPKNLNDLLYTALGFFFAAAIVALLTNIPLPYLNVKPQDLDRAIKSLWQDAPDVAGKRTAATYVKFLYRAQSLNQIKGYMLLAAMILEIVAVGFVALAVGSILTSI